MNLEGPNRYRPSPWAWLLIILVLLAYLPSLSAGFLIYDDGWLYEHNPLLAPGSWRTPITALTDFSRETRLILGAEYLPVRDLFAWFETRIFGLWAPGLHAMSVLLYIAAALLFRGALLRCLGHSLGVELAALLFALHPIHAESVSWLAGQKDLLALCFIGAALYVHAGERPRFTRWTVPVLVLLASLSKSMSVAVLGLLVAQDIMLRRRLDWRLYAGCFASIALTVTVHVYVGGLVGMVAEPLGGSRLNALISMGPVWLRYLLLCVAPWKLSIFHEVPARTQWDAASVLGTAFVLVSIAGSIAALRRGRRVPAFLALWFFAPLVPVSQVLVPLQNRMADRYLWLSVMAPCLLIGWGLGWALSQAKLPRALGWIALSVLFTFTTGATFQRSLAFSDSVLLFADSMGKTALNTSAPYQLGMALELEGREIEATAAFREVLRRAPEGHDTVVPKAANNLARLLAKRGQLPEAEAVLRGALRRFPDDPKLRNNLIKVLRGLGQTQEAAELESQRPNSIFRGSPSTSPN